MNNQNLINKIKNAAKEDERKRRDLRYKLAMAFLVRKGFLKANTDFADYYRAKVKAEDLIWAGKNVEPRILEVLPAAALRLPKAIKLNPLNKDERNLKLVVEDLLLNKIDGKDFLGMPYKKIKVWLDLPLNDRRTKQHSEKKVMKTFRLDPKTIQKIEKIRTEKNFKSDAALIEYLVGLPTI
jgi:hypothetical protein